jgi:hypothetical protein
MKRYNTMANHKNPNHTIQFEISRFKALGKSIPEKKKKAANKNITE